MKSSVPGVLLLMLDQAGLGGYVLEHKFHPARRWRADLSYPEHKLIVEWEGAVWSGGRHVRPKGFLGDVEKYNAAVLLGWRVLRFTAADDLQYILDTIKEALNGTGAV